MSVDYRSTVFLPQTDFPMKGELPQREPQLLERWAEMGLYDMLRAQSRGRKNSSCMTVRPTNGNLHLGTALNKILKDIIVRSKQMSGYDSVYVPGWDCHGLPNEWKIEEQYRLEKKNKDDVPIVEFRRECRIGEAPKEEKRSLFRELGLPYVTDPAISRHLNVFLEGAGQTPDAILFNGGFFFPKICRARVADVSKIGTAGGPKISGTAISISRWHVALPIIPTCAPPVPASWCAAAFRVPITSRRVIKLPSAWFRAAPRKGRQ